MLPKTRNKCCTLGRHLCEALVARGVRGFAAIFGSKTFSGSIRALVLQRSLKEVAILEALAHESAPLEGSFRAVHTISRL